MPIRAESASKVLIVAGMPQLAQGSSNNLVRPATALLATRPENADKDGLAL